MSSKGKNKSIFMWATLKQPVEPSLQETFPDNSLTRKITDLSISKGSLILTTKHANCFAVGYEIGNFADNIEMVVLKYFRKRLLK